LLEHPILNAKVSASETSELGLVYRTDHNIGVAMDTPRGLLVPNIKRVQDLSLFDIASELHRLQEAGRANSLKSEDLRGGTITLSNIGTFGGGICAPVISANEVCIGALGRAKKVPVWIEDKNGEGRTEGRLCMDVGWSGDHRVLDGVGLAKGVESWRGWCESGETMLGALR
jgi:2-oxoisovalerate dehydrogenase E2 component (dihydrolipoyl transacylase)